MSYTTRCNAVERKAFREHYTATQRKSRRSDIAVLEPALGSLEERLDIIFKRLDTEPRVANLRTDKEALAEARVS